MIEDFAREDLLAAIDRAVADLLAAAGVSGPPVDAVALAAHLGHTIRYEERARPGRVKAGAAVRITRLSAPPEVTQRLREIGLVESQVIRLLTSQTSFICEVCNDGLHSKMRKSRPDANERLVQKVRCDIDRDVHTQRSQSAK